MSRDDQEQRTETNFSFTLTDRREQTGEPFEKSRASPTAQLVKNLPAMQAIPVQFLGQEDPLEKG